MVASCDIEKIKEQALQAISNAKNLVDLESCRVQFLGKNSALMQALKSIGSLEACDRKQAGRLFNAVKTTLQQGFQEKKSALALGNEKSIQGVDVTMPGKFFHQGSWHPVYLTLKRIEGILSHLGFSTAFGPEIEDDYYNFQALNIPDHHPARAMHDTFYFSKSSLLRTHTSPVQIHVMENHAPPFAIIAGGKVYRCDSDLTHTPMFHQVEGLLIDKKINFAQLKGLLIHFLEVFFQKSLPIRFRASYFPFTEPSAEVDIQCIHCQGQGCRVCKKTGWLEVLGCGMVNQKVLSISGIDPNCYQGIAFGMGVERLAMLRYGIDDLRMFFENDHRFLKQFFGVHLGL